MFSFTFTDARTPESHVGMYMHLADQPNCTSTSDSEQLAGSVTNWQPPHSLSEPRMSNKQRVESREFQRHGHETKAKAETETKRAMEDTTELSSKQKEKPFTNTMPDVAVFEPSAHVDVALGLLAYWEEGDEARARLTTG